MDFLPIFLNIRGRRCAVIGGGEVAARKVSLLLEAGGAVTVYSPKLCAALAELRDAGRLQHVAERFSEGML
ncbi:MAG: hypothetical protein AMS22_14125, partial [Thiotrichales bacterium SG8_50]